MAEEMAIQIPRVQLGNCGFEVSKLGFGCMGLSWIYNSPAADEDGMAIIKHALSKGITFFDTTDVYEPHANEILLGKGTPEYVRSSCEGSLKRLDVDYIDLYYYHRVDTSVPIEEIMHEMKLVEEGKVKFIGLPEASPDTIRRAHTVHPITALQIEWSLWTRDIEEDIVPLCRELRVIIVPYSPLGRGFFGGKGVVESVYADSYVKSSVKKHACSPAQLALAWVLHQGNDVVPIPGTTKIKNLDSNIGSLGVKLKEEDVKEVSDAVPIDQVAGDGDNGCLMGLQSVAKPGIVGRRGEFKEYKVKKKKSFNEMSAVVFTLTKNHIFTLKSQT